MAELGSYKCGICDTELPSIVSECYNCVNTTHKEKLKRIVDLETEAKKYQAEIISTRNDFHVTNEANLKRYKELEAQLAELKRVVEHHKKQYRDMLKPWIERVERRDATITELKADAKINYGNYTRKATECIKERRRADKAEAQLAFQKRVTQTVADWYEEDSDLADHVIERAEAKTKEATT